MRELLRFKDYEKLKGFVKSDVLLITWGSDSALSHFNLAAKSGEWYVVIKLGDYDYGFDVLSWGNTGFVSEGGLSAIISGKSSRVRKLEDWEAGLYLL